MKTYHGAEDGWLEQAEKGRPFGRLLKPDEVARAVAFLASAESGHDDRLDHRLRPAGAAAPANSPAAAAGGLVSACRFAPARCRPATASVMASAMVAAIERKPSKFASTISSSTSAGEAIGENTESVIDDDLRAARLGGVGQRHRLAGIGREADRQHRVARGEMKLACSAPMPATASTRMLRIAELAHRVAHVGGDREGAPQPDQVDRLGGGQHVDGALERLVVDLLAEFRDRALARPRGSRRAPGPTCWSRCRGRASAPAARRSSAPGRAAASGTRPAAR